jgi:N-acetylneuraminic acid mutarotase
MAAAVLDGQVYVAGGFDSRFVRLDFFERYDPAADAWETLPPLPDARHHLGLAALDGRVYATGGFDSDSTTRGGARNGTWAFDVAAGEWAPVADMPGVRAEHAMAALEGKLYLVGGVDDTPEGPRALWVYDPNANTWDTSRAPAPYPISHTALVAAEGRLYLIGGRWAGNQRDVAIYDPTTDTWTRGPDLPTPRSGLTAAYVDGRIHVGGGEDIDAASVFGQHEVLDLASRTWSRLPNLPQARHGLVSAGLGGRWYVIGGGSPSGSTYVNVDVFEQH